jgi:hypothetical protein
VNTRLLKYARASSSGSISSTATFREDTSSVKRIILLPDQSGNAVGLLRVSNQHWRELNRTRDRIRRAEVPAPWRPNTANYAEDL